MGISFAIDLQTQLDRLQASGWTRDQIAAETGYTRRRLSDWTKGPDVPPKALQVGLLSVLGQMTGAPTK